MTFMSPFVSRLSVVTAYVVFAFVAALLGSLISFRNRFWGAVIGGILFAAIFVFWNHYPHPTVPLPVISTYTTPAG